MLARFFYALAKLPRYCRFCGKPLVADVNPATFDETTGQPVRWSIAIRCSEGVICFRRYGYLYKWHRSSPEDPFLENLLDP